MARFLPAMLAAVALFCGACATPTRSDVASNLPVVGAGDSTTCVVDPTKSLVCYGASVGDSASTFKVHLDAFTVPVGKVQSVSLSASSNVGCAIKADPESTVVCWGYQGVSNSSHVGLAKNPVVVPGVAGATSVSANGLRACAALVSGTVTCWSFDDQSDTPINIAPLTGIDSVATVTLGDHHGCALRKDGSVWCWGQNTHGELGNGTIAPSPTEFPPAPVAGLTATSVSAGSAHTCAVQDGTVKCWGLNREGEIGIPASPSPQSFPSPQLVANFSGVRAVSAGNSFNCAVMLDATVQCWGADEIGQLGIGSTMPQKSTPSPIPGLKKMYFASAGNRHACASGLGLAVKCWGVNDFGQLTNASTAPSSSPVP
jgi:alpha-tubulin suppressor-like RCC1 family protein